MCLALRKTGELKVTAQVFSALLAIVLGVGASVLYFAGTNWLLDTGLKDTRRNGQLVSREMTLPSPPRVMLALDLSLSDDELPVLEDDSPQMRRKVRQLAIERAVCLAASMICDAYLHGYQIGLAVLGAPAPVFAVHHSLPHRARMLEALAQVDPDGSAAGC